MSDDSPDRPLPDRLSVNPVSPYHDAEVLARAVSASTSQYCVSEGWIKFAAGKARDRGQPLTIQLKGKVEPFFPTPISRQESERS